MPTTLYLTLPWGLEQQKAAATNGCPRTSPLEETRTGSLSTAWLESFWFPDGKGEHPGTNRLEQPR